MDRTWWKRPGTRTIVMHAGIPSGRIHIRRFTLRVLISTLPVILLLVSP